MPPRNESGETRWQPLLRRADQGCLAVVVALSLIAIAGWCAFQWQTRGGLIEIDKAQRRPITFQVDINQAEWPELTLLPGVGETLAKNIVESRESTGPFKRHEELRRVRGIGPKTFDKIKPFLLPIADSQNVAKPAPQGT